MINLHMASIVTKQFRYGDPKITIHLPICGYINASITKMRPRVAWRGFYFCKLNYY